ncbi:MAG: hypothetical protein JKY45_13380, partial [Emcibacter sp.]|nr:hypothetical protein [Emcibacter sp.]
MRAYQSIKYITMVAAVALMGGCSAEQETIAPPEKKLISGVITENMNRTVKPGNDFFAYVNGTWYDSYIIPDDKASYGTFFMLHEKSQAAVKTIIEQSAKGVNPAGSNEQKVGDLYNSYLDMDKRNAIGTAPLMAVFA